MEDVEDLDLFTDTAVGDVRDPYPDFAKARAETPVAINTPFDQVMYSVYRYVDINRILREPETFSSRVYEPAMGIVMGPSILQMDGAEHHSHRSIIGGSFRRNVLATWEHTMIEPIVHELIDRFAARGNAELVQDFNFHYPIKVIAKILGVPVEDYKLFARLSIELISIHVNVERGMAASQSLREYLARILEERRQEPQDDLISALAAARINDVPLPDEEIFGFLRLLLPAGAETTQRLLGTLMFALLTHTDQLDAVREDRKLISAAIEEALRWEAPVQYVSREPVHDAEVAGVLIPAGSHMSLPLGSANRDETVFEDPDRFDIFRDGPPHLAFAEGPHRCLGEHLARLETTVAVNALLDRFPDIRLEPGDRDPHVHGQAFRSPNCVPVVFTPS